MSFDERLADADDMPAPRERDLARWVRALIIPVTILAWGALILAIFLLAGHLVETLIILAVALLIAYALSPIINRLNRRMPRWLAILITYLLFGAAFAAIIYVIAGAVSAEISQLGQYIQQLRQPGSNGGDFQSLLQRLGIPSSDVRNLGQTIFSGLTGLLRDLVPIISGVFTAAVGLVVIIVLSIYFTAAGPHIRRWMMTSTPRSHRARIGYFLETLDAVVGGYIRGQTTLAALVGLLVGLGMYFIFQLPFAILLGLLAFVLEYIPFLGVIISGAACVLVALTQGFFVAVLVLGYFIIIHLIEGEIVGPRIVGHAVGLHPAVSLIALIAGAELFGLWGALFASPVAGVIQSLVATFWSEYRRTHPEEFPLLAPEEAASEGRRDRWPWRRPPDYRGIFFKWRRPAHP